MKIKGNKRLKDEEYDVYRIRRDLENAFLKERKKGSLVWNSSMQGTYRKPQDE